MATWSWTHARLAAAIEATAEAVFITDRERRIQYANPAFETVTGYDRAEAVGLDAAALDGASPPKGCLEAREAGQVWRGERPIRRKQGQLLWTEQVVSPISDSDDAPLHFVITMRDVTEQHRLLEDLQRAVMVKTEFTSTVSHELRTPLTAIKEAIDLVADGTAGEVNSVQEEFLELAKRNVDRLHRLINDTLDFSKLERGAFRLSVVQQDLNRLVLEIVRQQRLAARKEGLRLEATLDPNLGPVWFDSDRISQVLVNLISNEIRYCEKGWIEVATECRKGEAIVRVQDSGPGIPPDQVQSIFDAFVQLSTGPGRKVGGTGLGLAIASRLVELHGGRIWVESEVGKGSAFYFALRIGFDRGQSKEDSYAEDESSRG